MLKKEARRITGGLSDPGKMPEGSYNLPAAECQTGAKLRLIPDTPCYKCYAFKGNYKRFPAVQKALYRRLASLTHPQWVEGMTTLVKKIKHFRWHDSGDIQSVDHLKKILKFVTTHQGPCTGCQRRSASTCPFRARATPTT